MPRRMKFETTEIGTIEVLAISQRGDTWEEPWNLLRGTRIGNLFSQVSRGNMNHMLYGFSTPFVRALGIPPEGALRKLPSSECWRKCSLYDKKLCTVLTKKQLPWCFEPDTEGGSQEVQSLASEAVRYWREKVYIVIVLEDQLHA